jgi:hypothetical protein
MTMPWDQRQKQAYIPYALITMPLANVSALLAESALNHNVATNIESALHQWHSAYSLSANEQDPYEFMELVQSALAQVATENQAAAQRRARALPAAALNQTQLSAHERQTPSGAEIFFQNIAMGTSHSLDRAITGSNDDILEGDHFSKGGYSDENGTNSESGEQEGQETSSSVVLRPRKGVKQRRIESDSDDHE